MTDPAANQSALFIEIENAARCLENGMAPATVAQKLRRLAAKEVERVDIVFDGPPGHFAPQFVEVENSEGKSFRLGEWVKRPDGYWAIRFSAALFPDMSPLKEGE